ncbi:glycoside hydrolase superfamily [Pseudoneurospora amorphoporcata]|uniref:alpha-amylase n=1 Tax=Pseudoneurospora amorphoporcata TaxID=241081 RepID=A0AAN6NYD4_9PEZI|nr:glycoside hydrolase superfamily [Pseudoneurospora amorphoporcata]
MRSSLLTGAVAAALSFSGYAAAADAEAWKSRSIYQVMIDRFARTDGGSVDCKLHEFCGGTWKGLTNKLDYIQGMGFDAIQISPVIKNMDEDTAVGEPYHGYWSQDLTTVNPKFGTKEDLKNLVDELHKRDMFLMVDVVVNHMAQKFDNIIPPKVDYSKFKPFNDQKYFHSYCNVTEWENSTNYQNCWLYPFGVALADIKTESPDVVTLFTKWIKDLVSTYSIDGLRIDAAKHVNDEFLPKFVEASGVFAFGEVLTGVTEDMCRYQNKSKNLLPGMPNYLDFYPLNAAFNGGDFERLGEIRAQAVDSCNDTLALGTFIENHDMPRFASQNDDLALAKNAMTYVIMNDGIPTVYQGQEQHFKGGETPSNREPLWTSNYNTTAPLYVLASTLNKVRKNAIKQSPDYIKKTSDVLIADTNHFCQSKGPAENAVVFCITNKSSQGDSYEMTVGGFRNSDEVVEVISCASSTADGLGQITAYMGAGEPKVWVKKSALEGTDICPKTTVDGPKENSGVVAKGAASAGVLMAAVLGTASLLL